MSQQHFRLKRFASSCLATLRPMFPVREIKGHLDDPERIGLIYPDKEWEFESPSRTCSDEQSPFQTKDWVFFYGCNPDTKSRLVIFLERINQHLAVVWILLQLEGGQVLLQKEACFSDNSHGHVFSAGGLRLEVDAPMRRWRLLFNGLLENSEGGRDVHVRLAARFASLGHPYEFPRDVPPSKFARRFEQTAEGGHIEQLKETMRKATSTGGYEQAGTFYCEAHVDGVRSEFLLWGTKLRYIGSSPLFTKCCHHFGYATNGAVFHLIESTNEKCYGFCYTPSLFMKGIRKGRTNKSGRGIAVAFSVGDVAYKGQWGAINEQPIAGSLSPAPESQWQLQTSWGRMTQSNISDEVFNCGLLSLRFSEEYNIPERLVTKYAMVAVDQFWPDADTAWPLIVTLDDTLCRDPAIAGGKGASLAQLTAISADLKTFIVPKALVLTVFAFDEFSSQPAVKAAIKRLEERCSDAEHLDAVKLQEASAECVEAVLKADMKDNMEQLLQSRMVECFGSVDGVTCRTFAVRSSSTNEDTDELSAAGQMTTCLAVQGMHNIKTAIIKCWASQFSFTALSYKRQHGQALCGASTMAVVVQQMVQAECAGVLFTCNPVSGHPEQTVVTANFGLGESVVSGLADPDTFTLHKLRAPGGLTRFAVELKTLGNKNAVVVPKASGGTEERVLGESLKEDFCIDDEKAKELANIAMQIESFYNTPRDIEWALRGGEVYILQSRPVTSLLKESDFEITHDMNTAISTDREILSRANIEEVMPGVLTPITLDLFRIIFDLFVTRLFRSRFPMLFDSSPYAPRTTCQLGKRVFINFSMNLLGAGHDTLDRQVLTTFGSAVKEHEVYTRGMFHYSTTSRLGKYKAGQYALQLAFGADKILRKARTAAENFSVDLPPANEGSSSKLIWVFAKQLHQMRNGLPYLTGVSSSSMNWSLVAVRILGRALGPQTPHAEVMSSFAQLVRSKMDIESADIPSSLQNLALKIMDSSLGARFGALEPGEAYDLLRNDQGEAGEHFRAFMARHGDRCYKEFDYISRPWSMDPQPVITSLQAYCNLQAVRRTDSTAAAAEQTKAEKEQEMESTLADIQGRLGFIDRQMLDFILPQAKKAVYVREAAKAALMSCLQKLRLALRRIGRQLQKEGRLPDSELVFFLTLDEAFRLANGKNPSLVHRAIRRQRLHPKLNSEKVPMLSCGMPKFQTAEQGVKVDPNATSVSGTPVSEGIAIGPARIVDNFESEAPLIQQGDILITHATDTGWTPYFPMLAGVVTEIGGLLSHGAVVAREFGLPAVVGAQYATQVFRTGDTVRLDAHNGVCALVAKTKSNDPPVKPVRGALHIRPSSAQSSKEPQPTDSIRINAASGSGHYAQPSEVDATDTATVAADALTDPATVAAAAALEAGLDRQVASMTTTTTTTDAIVDTRGDAERPPDCSAQNGGVELEAEAPSRLSAISGSGQQGPPTILTETRPEANHESSGGDNINNNNNNGCLTDDPKVPLLRSESPPPPPKVLPAQDSVPAKGDARLPNVLLLPSPQDPIASKGNAQTSNVLPQQDSIAVKSDPQPPNSSLTSGTTASEAGDRTVPMPRRGSRTKRQAPAPPIRALQS